MANGIEAMEEQRMGRLQQERFQDKISMEESVKDLSERVAAKLNQLIAQGHDTIAFGIAIGLAILKDGVDEIPIIGWFLGLFVSATLMYFLWGKGWFNQTKVKIILWGFGLFFDNIPILSVIPISVLTILMAWHIVRKRAKKAEEDLAELGKKTQEELEVLEQEE